MKPSSHLRDSLADQRGAVVVRGNEVYIIFHALSNLSSDGLQYEIWMERSNGTRESLGRLEGRGNAWEEIYQAVSELIGFASEKSDAYKQIYFLYDGDFNREVSRIILSVEPKPDYSPEPTGIELYEAVIH